MHSTVLMGLITVGILKFLSSVVKSFTSSASLVLTSMLTSIIFDIHLKYPFNAMFRNHLKFDFITHFGTIVHAIIFQTVEILHFTVAFYLAVFNLSIAIYLYRSFPAPPKPVVSALTTPIDDYS